MGSNPKKNKQNDVKFNNQIWLPKDCSPYKELEMHSIFNKCNGIHNKQVLVRKLKEILRIKWRISILGK
jgi:hypothetical protein